MSDTERERQERQRRILDMVASGKMTAAEGAQQLAALGYAPVGPCPEDDEAGEADAGALGEPVHRRRGDGQGAGGRARAIRVVITDVRTGQVKVNLALPLALAEVALRFVPRDSLERAGVNVDRLHAALGRGETGLVFATVDHEDHQSIEVLVE